MKTIGPAFAALRTASGEARAANDSAALVTQNAAKLQPAFTQTERVWNELGQSAAAEWARTAPRPRRLNRTRCRRRRLGRRENVCRRPEHTVPELPWRLP